MGVAQLVEHLVVVQDVAGSSPVTHPNNKDPGLIPWVFVIVGSNLAGGTWEEVVLICTKTQYDRTLMLKQRGKR